MARSFNGTSDVIAANAAATFGTTASYSVAAWVKAALNGSGADQVFFSEGNSAATRPFMELINQAATGLVAVRLSSTSANVLSVAASGIVFDGTWHHICHTQDGAGNYAIYCDGVVGSSGSYSLGTAGTTNRCTIGAFVRNTTANFYPGTVAEVAKWTRQLTAKEAVSLAAGLPASHLGPSHYWPLWGSDSPEPDIGSGAHTAGTLTGTTRVNGARVGRRLLTLA